MGLLLTSRPAEFLSKAAKMYPGLWLLVDFVRERRGKGGMPTWPGWCYFPLSALDACLGRLCPTADRFARVPVIGILGALVAWRVTQGLYRFDPDVFEEVWKTPVTGILPVGLFLHLPEWCCYVVIDPPEKVIHGFDEVQGFFVYMEYDYGREHVELRYVMDFLNEGLLSVALQLEEGRDLRRTVMKTFETIAKTAEAYRREVSDIIPDFFSPTNDDIVHGVAESLMPLVSLTLYLCQTASDLKDQSEKRVNPTRPQITKTKKGDRMFPPDSPTVWEVGVRVGAALRLARSQAKEEPEVREWSEEGLIEVTRSRGRPRSHLRRAHWHLFWVGKGRTEPRVKWLHPILVGTREGLVPTIHPVE